MLFQPFGLPFEVAALHEIRETGKPAGVARASGKESAEGLEQSEAGLDGVEEQEVPGLVHFDEHRLARRRDDQVYRAESQAQLPAQLPAARRDGRVERVRPAGYAPQVHVDPPVAGRAVLLALDQEAADLLSEDRDPKLVLLGDGLLVDSRAKRDLVVAQGGGRRE